MRLLLLILFSVACSTPHEVKELESGELDIKGSTTYGKVGLNEKKQVVIRNEKSADFELTVQQMANERLRDEAIREVRVLQLCREELADPRLGGNGKITNLPAVDGLQAVVEQREEVGLDEGGNLNVVQEEYFMERLKAERKYEKDVRRLLETATKHRKECDMQLTAAKEARHG
jgi:hypothetical protein